MDLILSEVRRKVRIYHRLCSQINIKLTRQFAFGVQSLGNSQVD